MPDFTGSVNYNKVYILQTLVFESSRNKRDRATIANIAVGRLNDVRCCIVNSLEEIQTIRSFSGTSSCFQLIRSREYENTKKLQRVK